MKLFQRKKASDSGEEFDAEEGTAPRSESTLPLTHVGPYRIVAPVGTGGMGTVYKAIDPARDRTVAIKVLDRRYDLDKKRRRRDYLGREILIAASLKHDCIIKMHNQLLEQEDAQGNIRRCLLMEYVDGHNLRKHIVERDLSVPQMIKLCIRLCHGIDFLHQNSIVHRDVKPENFLFSRSQQFDQCHSHLTGIELSSFAQSLGHFHHVFEALHGVFGSRLLDDLIHFSRNFRTPVMH